MYTNFSDIRLQKQDRVLIIMGATHTPILTFSLEISPKYMLRKFAEYTKFYGKKKLSTENTATIAFSKAKCLFWRIHLINETLVKKQITPSSQCCTNFQFVFAFQQHTMFFNIGKQPCRIRKITPSLIVIILRLQLSTTLLIICLNARLQFHINF